MTGPAPQVLLVVPREPRIVAGLPAVLRAAQRLAAVSGGGPALLCGASESFRRRWARELARLPVREVEDADLGRAVRPDAPIVIVASDGMLSADGPRGLAEEAERRGQRMAWTWKGNLVCVYAPAAGDLVERWKPGSADPLAAALDGVVRVEAPAGSWIPVESPEELAEAEEKLYAGLSHGRDGYLSQFDRKISIALSRQLNKTRVTPNQITAVSILIGLAGAALIASPDGAVCFVGALLAWFSSILDGCDGEIARLKLLFSDAGRKFDLFGDYLVNFSVLAAVAWHVHRTRPEAPLGSLMLLLASGVALASLLAWWLFVRKPGRRPEGLLRIFQRLASRDFVYGIVVLAAVDRLEWFLYGAAIGAHLFWIGLGIAVLVRSRVTAVGRPGRLPVA